MMNGTTKLQRIAAKIGEAEYAAAVVLQVGHPPVPTLTALFNLPPSAKIVASATTWTVEHKAPMPDEIIEIPWLQIPIVGATRVGTMRLYGSSHDLSEGNSMPPDERPMGYDTTKTTDS